MAAPQDPREPASAGGPGAGRSLHRVMGPWLLLLFIVCDILGTGIYALTGPVAPASSVPGLQLVR